MQPTVAVLRAGERWSRSIPQLVQVPTIGWASGGESVEERVADVVDRLLLEILVAHFYRRSAEAIASAAPESGSHDHLAMLTWVPEPWSLMHVLAELVDPQIGEFEAVSEDQRIIVAYPGFGLRARERLELDSVAAKMERFRSSSARAGTSAQTRVRFVSQDRLVDGTVPEHEVHLDGMWVCLSGGGSDAEIEAAGVGMPHVDDMFTRLSRRFLESGARIIYAGTLSDLGSNLTKSLIEVARGWARERQEAERGRSARTASELDDAPFRNYSAWPDTRHVLLRHEADLVGMCKFEKVLPPGRDDDPPPIEEFRKTKEGKVLYAEALSRMRAETCSRVLEGRDGRYPLRIVIAGKIAESAGYMPGIAEEVACALAGRQLPIVLGAFSGCAGVLAEFLACSEEHVEWPPELDFCTRRQDETLRTILRGAREQVLLDRYAHVRARISQYREELHGLHERPWPFAARVREHVVALLRESRSSEILRRTLLIADTVR